MFSDITITIIIPVYNSEKYLHKCIDSVIYQTYKNLDIILVDDGSTDASGKICDEYAALESRVRVFHKENGGQTSARNVGIRNAVGSYIAFLDSDDFIDEDTFEKILAFMQPGVYPDMVAYNLIEEYREGSLLKRNSFFEGIYDRADIESIILPQALSFGYFFNFGILPNLVCKLIKRKFIDALNISVSENVKFGEDADVVFQLLPNLELLQIIDYAPYHYNKRNDSMLWKQMNIDQIECLKKDLASSFSKYKLKDILLSQLEDYITFVYLLKCPKSILKEKHLIETNARIALYGAGGFGQAVFKEYSCSVVLWVDQAYERYQVQNMPVVDVNELLKREKDYDFIYIAILNMDICEKISNELKKKGIVKKINYYKRG